MGTRGQGAAATPAEHSGLPPAGSAGSGHPFALEAQDICKRFGGQVALDKVSLAVEPGTTHGIIGENGAGKSTLISILAGITAPDSGSLLAGGQAVTFRNAEDARQRGIMVVHQEPLIFRDLTVAENVMLANRQWQSGFCTRRGIEKFVRRSFTELGIELDPQAEASTLTAGEGALVEIARAVDQDARVVIFDEPTSALSASEARLVTATIQRLAATGVAVILISHRLSEIFELSGTVTVLRNGRRVAVRETRCLSQHEAVTLMLGRPPEQMQHDTRDAATGTVLLRCADVRTAHADKVSFELHAGEILGLAGLRGAGQASLAKAVAGIEPVVSGRIETGPQGAGTRAPGNTALSYLPEDRQREGLFPWFSIARNIGLGARTRSHWWSRQKPDTEIRLAQSWITRLDIRPPDAGVPVALLSGGNQQKVLIARCLARDPAVLVLNNPGRGVDVGAKAQIYETIERLRRQGLGILLVSDDVEEMAMLGTRFCIFRHGRVVATKAAPAGPDDIAMAISGQEEK